MRACTFRRFVRLLGAGLAGAACAWLPAAAQTPQPVKLLVGYAAGGPLDTAARQFAVEFQRRSTCR